MQKSLSKWPIFVKMADRLIWQILSKWPIFVKLADRLIWQMCIGAETKLINWLHSLLWFSVQRFNKYNKVKGHWTFWIKNKLTKLSISVYYCHNTSGEEWAHLLVCHQVQCVLHHLSWFLWAEDKESPLVFFFDQPLVTGSFSPSSAQCWRRHERYLQSRRYWIFRTEFFENRYCKSEKCLKNILKCAVINKNIYIINYSYLQLTNEFFSDLKQRPRKAESWLEVRKVSEYQRWSKVMEVSGYSLLPRAGKRIPARLERPAGSGLETTTTILSDNDLGPKP